MPQRCPQLTTSQTHIPNNATEPNPQVQGLTVSFCIPPRSTTITWVFLLSFIVCFCKPKHVLQYCSFFVKPLFVFATHINPTHPNHHRRTPNHTRNVRGTLTTTEDTPFKGRNNRDGLAEGRSSRDGTKIQKLLIITNKKQQHTVADAITVTAPRRGRHVY